MAKSPASSPPPAPVWVRFLGTVDPTPADKMTYLAGSEWHMPVDRAEQLLDAGVVELIDPPAAAMRVVTEPLEPELPTPATFVGDDVEE